MTANFLSLSSELRNKIYELLLLHPHTVNPRDHYLRPDTFSPGLFLASKIVHIEATSFFYAQNCFDLTSYDPKDLQLFLNQIGRNNANCIRHVLMNFPGFQCLDLDNVTLETESIHILATLQSDCANLNKITTSLDSTDNMELKLDALDHPNIIRQALTLMNARFRAISSLHEIVVEVYRDGPSDHIRKDMEMHGWTISANECVSECRFDDTSGYSEEDDYPSDSNSFDDDDEDYDIDNDSDFWRRAGD